MRSNGRLRDRTTGAAHLIPPLAVAASVLACLAAPAASAQRIVDRPVVVEVFDRVDLSFMGADAPKEEGTAAPRGDLVLRDRGQTADRIVSLPSEPSAETAVAVLGIVTVEPIPDPNQSPRPGDPWTRVGSVGVLVPLGGGKPPMQVELMRFVTGFGAPGRFEADLTPFLPLLWGERTLRVHLGTWKTPGWRVSFEIRYEPGLAGVRRPTMVVPLLDEPVVTAATGRMQASFTLLPGMDRPRLRILSTGHGSDLGDEFIPRTHVVRVDGVEVARWRPWREDGNRARSSSPWAERRRVDGREVWASDADRAGWIPGRIVEPFIIPLDELPPGRHRIEIEILDIRKTPEGQPVDHWRLSVAAVADQDWPTAKPVRP